MGDLHVNYEALQRILHELAPFPKHHPRRLANDVGRPFYVEDIATAGIANPTQKDWEGCGLLVAVEGSTVGARLRVSFHDNGNNEGFTLSPGDSLDIPRRFKGKLWVQSVGAAGTVRVVVSRDELVRLDQQRRAGTPSLQTITAIPVTTPPTLATEGVALGPQYTHVTVQFGDDVTPAARIVGAETADIEVWFRLVSGLWAHNPTDDFDAAGRTPATGSHDWEVYAIPRNVDRIYFNKTAGNTFHAHVMASESEAR